MSIHDSFLYKDIRRKLSAKAAEQWGQKESGDDLKGYAEKEDDH